MRYKTMIADNQQQVDRVIHLCEYYGVAYYIDSFRSSMGMDGAYVHLMKSKDAVRYMNNGGIWSYTIPFAHHLMEGVGE